MKKAILALSLLFCILILTSCGDTYQGELSWGVNDFTFTDQDGEKISQKGLEGKFWVADFIFTNCETVCPPMTANMAILQDKLKEAGLDDVELVSFSIDPERDTKKALKEFGKAHGASFDNWHFLTGYDFQTIKELSIKSFKSPIEAIEEGEQYMHGTSFFLISPEGNAIERYKGTQANSMDKIVKDIKELKIN